MPVAAVKKTKSPARSTAAERVASDLRERLGAGAFLPGSLFPGRRALGREYDCGPLTIEQAIKLLVSEGLLRTEDRRGTFVADSILSELPVRTQRPLGSPSSERLRRGAMVGIVTPIAIGDASNELSRHGSDKIVDSFERYISEFDGVTRLFCHNDERDNVIDQVDAAKAAIDAGCDALLVAMHYGEEMAETLISLTERHGLAIVFAGGEPLRPPAISVYYDHEDAGEQACSHLLGMGIDDLYFFAHYSAWWVCDRARGAYRAATSGRYPNATLRMNRTDLLDLQRGPQLRGPAPEHELLGYRHAVEVLEGGLPARGIIAANDFCAMGFVKAASERGFVAGRDYALVGFDNHPKAKYGDISSMQPPWESMGREAGRLLVAAMADPKLASQKVCLHSFVVARMSTRMPKTAQDII